MSRCDIIVALVCFVIFTMFAYAAGNVDGEENLKDELVASGKAEYYLDEKNERRWRIKQ